MGLFFHKADLKPGYYPCEFRLQYKATTTVTITAFELHSQCSYHNHRLEGCTEYVFNEKDRPGRTAIIYDRLKVKDSAKKAPVEDI